MSRTLQISLIVGVVVVALLMVMPFLISVNQFRPAIEQEASAVLGRKVDIGRLHLSLLRRSVSAETLAVSDDPAFSTSPFLTATSVTVGVEIWPLIRSRSLNVTRLRIKHPDVTLIRNSAGRWNYASLGSSASGNGSSAFSIDKLALDDGRIVVGRAGQKREYDHVNVTASNVSSASPSAVVVTAELPGAGMFRLTGRVGPVDRTDASLTPLDATVAVDRLNLATTGLLDPSVGLGGVLDLKATVASDHGEVDVAADGTLSKALLVAGGSPAAQPVVLQLKTTYDLRTHEGVLNPSTLRMGGATAHFDGTYDGHGEYTIVNIKTAGGPMPAGDLESFLPALGIHLPQKAHLTAGTFVAKLDTVGATNRLVTTGTVGLSSARLSGFDLGASVRAISAFTGLNTGKDLDIEDITTHLRIAADGLRFDHLDAVVRSLGHVSGVGTIDEKNNLDFVMAATLATPLAGDVGSAIGTAGVLKRGAVGSAIGTAGALNAVLGRFTGSEATRQTKSEQIPFRVQGTTSDPRFLPDVGGTVIQMLKGQLGVTP